jgi:hypothetical protein
MSTPRRWTDDRERQRIVDDRQRSNETPEQNAVASAGHGNAQQLWQQAQALRQGAELEGSKVKGPLTAGISARSHGGTGEQAFDTM